MKQLFSNKQIYTQIIILILSNIVITGISLIIFYNQSINTLEKNLLDIVNRQKALISIFEEEGKSTDAIIQCLKKIHAIGKSGEFTIAHLQNDSIVFLLAGISNTKFKTDQEKKLGIPMRMALSQKTGFIKGIDYKGQRAYAAYTYLPSLKWGIVAKIPSAEINKSYLLVTAISIFISISLIFIWILLFSRASNSLINKIINSEEHYRSLFEKNHFSMLVINPNTLQITDANLAACQYYGYSHAKITSLRYSDINILPVDEIKQIFKHTKENLKTESQLKHKLDNGDIKDVEVLRGLIKINNELLVYSIIYDITERLETERKLIESEETYRALFGSINDAIFVSQIDSNDQFAKFIQVNDIACQRLGYSRQELLTMSPYQIHTEKSKQTRGAIFEQLFKDKHAIFELEHLTKDGRVIPVEISTRITHFKDKKLSISVVRDISERKMMAEKLHQNLTLMSNTQSLAKIGGWEWNLADNIMYWTDETYRIHDIKIDDIDKDAQNHIALSQKCYHPQEQKIIMEAFNDCVTLGFPYDLELPFTTTQGRQLWIRTVAQAVWQDGKIAKVVGSIADITDRKLIELSLKEKTDEIEAQNEEYKQINSELLEAKAKAEENDRLKTAFLQNMSHEIRTPMNAIMGFSELLASNFDNKAKLEQFTKIINQRCADLLHIINEILDIAKIESGQLTIHLDEFKLNDLFKELQVFFTEHQRKLNKGHINFIIANGSNDPDIVLMTDKVKLKQIFINLISNAFKFTDEGQIIAGCQHDQNNKLTFFVSDTGLGIPTDKHDYIFQRFSQIHHESKSNYGGTGLGLSIVKGLVELLDGTIRVESHPGEGSTFYFTLSYNQLRKKEPEIIYHRNDNPFYFKNKTVLVVEDDQYNAEYLNEILTNAGFNIIHTIYGLDAVKLSANNHIDIVLMDVNLPDISGYEASQKILIQKPSLKIIAQTAFAAPADKQKALDSGCVDYLSKPLNQDELLFVLFKHLMLN